MRKLEAGMRLAHRSLKYLNRSRELIVATPINAPVRVLGSTCTPDPSQQRRFARVTGELFQAKLPPGNDRILEWVRGVPGPVAVTYEAGPTGFGLYRALTGAGVRCVVAAPSKLQRPSGDRVKTDAKDAVHLARLLRLDEITAVTVPTADQEAARDLVRAREECRGDLMRAAPTPPRRAGRPRRAPWRTARRPTRSGGPSPVPELTASACMADAVSSFCGERSERAC